MISIIVNISLDMRLGERKPEPRSAQGHAVVARIEKTEKITQTGEKRMMFALKEPEREREMTRPPPPPPPPQILACHGEDADHQADAPVAQQSHLRLIPLALPGLPLGLDGGPDADAQHQQVEEHHDAHPGDVEGHGGAAGFLPRERASAEPPG